MSATSHGQVIQDLDITATGSVSAVQVGGYQNVTIRNCRIRHEYRSGIEAWGNFSGLLIEDCDIECSGAPSTGPNANADMENIRLWGDGRDPQSVVVRRVRLTRGSSGVYARFCPDIVVEQVEGHDFRGPFPRGQVVQFHHCVRPVLQDFSVICAGDRAWTEDSVNTFGCTDPVIRRGFIRGNNSPSGVGVLIENSTGGSGGLIEDVDVLNWINNGFSAADNSSNVTFRRCRAKNVIRRGDDVVAYLGGLWGNTSANRTRNSQPESGGQEAFVAWLNGSGIRYEDCQFFNSNGWWFHNPGGVAHRSISQSDFAPRSPIALQFGWES